jgi:hypothetical protein
MAPHLLQEVGLWSLDVFGLLIHLSSQSALAACWLWPACSKAAGILLPGESQHTSRNNANRYRDLRQGGKYFTLLMKVGMYVRGSACWMASQLTLKRPKINPITTKNRR